LDVLTYKDDVMGFLRGNSTAARTSNFNEIFTN